MKKIIVLFCLGLFLVNCSDSDDSMELITNLESTIVVIEDETEETSTTEFTGDFVSAAHPTSGIATVNSNQSTLNFTNFKTDDGPKLLVYLSTDIGAQDFVNLGDLKGVEGNYSYAIPEGTDIEKYKIVDIWCVDFSVSFGHAELKK